MTFRKLPKTVTRPGVEVALYYDAPLREYRCRLFTEGQPQYEADYFTSDKIDALDTATRMADRSYRTIVLNKALSIPVDELAELRRIVTHVWQQIGHDVMACSVECGEEVSNEAAVESCLDADRPGEMCGKTAAAFTKLAYQKYGFDAVRLAVSKHLHLV